MTYWRRKKREQRKVNSVLALSRKKGESIIINNNIEITILEIKGDQIKIGINAPKSVPIYRKEIYGQIQEENKVSGITQERETMKKLLSNL